MNMRSRLTKMLNRPVKKESPITFLPELKCHFNFNPALPPNIPPKRNTLRASLANLRRSSSGPYDTPRTSSPGSEAEHIHLSNQSSGYESKIYASIHKDPETSV